MIRRSLLLWIVLAASLGFPLYLMKYEVQAVEEELQRVNREIVRNEEAIHVLKAEWAFLNRPDKLASLTVRHLELKPLDARQLADMGALNARVQEVRVAPRETREKDAAVIQAAVRETSREPGRDPAKVIRASAVGAAPVPPPSVPAPSMAARATVTQPAAAAPIVVPPPSRPAAIPAAAPSRPANPIRPPVVAVPVPGQSIAQNIAIDLAAAPSLASAKAFLP
jgi:hypothetical protein